MVAGRKKLDILVTDSAKNSREAVTEIFSSAGYNVTSAASGSETIELLTRETFDLIICDIDLPRSSGLEVVRMAHALNQKAKILVVSSSGGSAMRKKLKKEGAFDLLDKPLRKVTLLDAAREALKRAPSRRKKEMTPL